MDDGDDRSDVRLVAACEACGSVYAATEISTGEIQPIGSRDGCTCGSTTFIALDETGDFDSAEGEESTDEN